MSSGYLALLFKCVAEPLTFLPGSPCGPVGPGIGCVGVGG